MSLLLPHFLRGIQCDALFILNQLRNLVARFLQLGQLLFIVFEFGNLLIQQLLSADQMIDRRLARHLRRSRRALIERLLHLFHFLDGR